MEAERTELTTEQRHSAVSALKNAFQEGVEVIEILENSRIVDKPVEYLTEASKIIYKPVHFTWYKSERYKNKMEVKYSGTVLVIIPGSPGARYVLMRDNFITHAKAFKSGEEIDILDNLCEDYSEWEPSREDWKKAKGLGLLGNEKDIEVHWFQHPKVGGFPPSISDIETVVGAVIVKFKKKRTIEEERVVKGEATIMERVEVAEDNLFSKVKLISDTKVITTDGIVITSETVLTLLKELKQFIVKKDVNGFWHFMRDSSKRKHLTAKEKQFFHRAIIAENDVSVFELLVCVDDLLNP